MSKTLMRVSSRLTAPFGGWTGQRDAKPAAKITGLLVALACATFLLIFASNAQASGNGASQILDPGKPKAKKQIIADTTAPHLRGHGGPVKAIVASADASRLLTGSFDYSMILWQADPDGTYRLKRRFADHDGAVSAAAFFTTSSRAIAASDDGALSIWDLETGQRQAKLIGHSAKILGLDISPDQKLIATASWDRTVRLWNALTGQPIATLTGHQGPVNAVRFSHDGKNLVSAANDGALNLWNVAQAKLLRPAYKHGWGINVLEHLPSTGQFAFGALDGTAAIVDFSTGKLVHKLGPRDKPILALAHLAKPGLLAVGGSDGLIDIYRTGDWQHLEQFKNPYGPVWAMSFVDQGARLYYGSLDDIAFAWQITPRKPFEQAPALKFPRRFQVADDMSLGERQFARKCSICHTLSADGRNRAGPTLHGIFGRRIASLPGYPFSDALKKMNIVWNEETIGKLFELGPPEFTPGSKMPLQKIQDSAERHALIAYLKTKTADQNNQQQK